MTTRPSVLLTGATGTLGTAIHARLREDVDLILHARRSCPPGGVQVELTEEGEVERMVEELKPDIVLHTAAARNPDLCEEDQP